MLHYPTLLGGGCEDVSRRRSVVVATVIPGSCNLFRPTNQEQQHEGCFAGVFVVMLPPALTLNRS